MKWDDAGYSRYDVDENGNPLTLEEYEQRQHAGGRFSLSKGEIKLLGIAGVGFFLDSYDLFIINLVTPIWTYEYWGGLQHKKPHYPPLLRGVVNAGANIGNIIGQLTFGFLGDALGRKFVYGKELIIAMIGMIMVIALPNSIPTPTLKMVWIFCFRLLMGIGIGGDYPMSASITSERAHLKRRGTLLGIIFSNQGWGTLAGSIVTIIILACFEPALNKRSEYGQLDAVWRIQMGVALVPAAATLWPRLKMPEGKQYLQSQELNAAKKNASNSSAPNVYEKDAGIESGSQGSDIIAPGQGPLGPPPKKSTEWAVFFKYFSEWRHFKLLFGTASTWFLVDVAFYGVNLNQSVILSEIGFSTGRNEYHILMKNALGNLIIAVAGYVPGYFVTIALIERLGRKWIQTQGFIMCAIFFAILAGAYHHLGTAGKFICFAFAQFFFNFGPNATTFIVPAELFPSRVRGFAHGMSAAVGKLGAILSALLFNYLSSSVIGLQNVLWIFFACNVLGAIITWFLIPETRGRDADVVDYEEFLAANPDYNRRTSMGAAPIHKNAI